MADLDIKAIRHSLDLAKTRGFEEVRLVSGGVEFYGRFGARTAAVSTTATEPQGAEPATAVPGDEPVDINAPCVGFYQPSDPPLEAGQHVSHGDVVATISALGLANDLESPITGEVVEVLVEPNAPVQFGQPIARVKVGA